jgi:hypothetical protein
MGCYSPPPLKESCPEIRSERLLRVEKHVTPVHISDHITQFQAKASISGCGFSSGYNMYRLKRCPSIETISARRTHKVPCVQFAFSDDTVLSESVRRVVDMRLYPNRISCNLLGKTQKEVYQQVVTVSS